MGDPEAMVAQEKISEAARILAQVARPQKIILFGSYGRGAPREESDVDLLVVEAEVEDRAVEMTRLSRALSPLRISVDLLVVSREMFEYGRPRRGTCISMRSAKARCSMRRHEQAL
jgi:predicted nucleotidyltransferase